MIFVLDQKSVCAALEPVFLRASFLAIEMRRTGLRLGTEYLEGHVTPTLHRKPLAQQESGHHSRRE